MDATIVAAIDALPRHALVTLLDDVGVPASATTSRTMLSAIVLNFYLDHHLSAADILAAHGE